MFKMFTNELNLDGEWITKKYENVISFRSYFNQVKYKCIDGITREIDDAKINAVLPQFIIDQDEYEKLIEEEMRLEWATCEDPEDDDLIEQLMKVRKSLERWDKNE